MYIKQCLKIILSVNGKLQDHAYKESIGTCLYNVCIEHF